MNYFLENPVAILVLMVAATLIFHIGQWYKLEFTPETKSTWNQAAQAECGKYWPGTKVHFEQWREVGGGVVATYLCR